MNENTARQLMRLELELVAAAEDLSGDVATTAIEECLFAMRAAFRQAGDVLAVEREHRNAAHATRLALQAPLSTEETREDQTWVDGRPPSDQGK